MKGADAPRNSLLQARALGAVGAGMALLAGAAWVFRTPLAESILSRELASRGVEAQLEVADVGFSGITLRDARLGPAADPQATADRLTARLAWGWTGPKLARLDADGLTLRVGVGPEGLDLGHLKPLLPPPSKKPPRLPDLTLDLSDATLVIATPLGSLEGPVSIKGALRGNFTATSRLAGAGDALEGANVAIDATGEAGRIAARAVAAAPSWVLPANGGAVADLTASASMTSDADFRSISASIETKASRGEVNGVSAEGVSANGRIEAEAIGPGFVPASFRLETQLAAERADLPGALRLNGVRGGLSLAGAADKITGPIRLDATTADAPFAGAETVSFVGTVSAGAGEGAVNGEAIVHEARLKAASANALSSAAPDLAALPAGAPIAALESALLRAGRDFRVRAPLLFTWGADGAALWLAGPARGEAATGLAIEIAGPNPQAAFGRLAWPAGEASAGGSISLSGGGAPRVSVGLEEVRWGGRRLAASGRVAFDGGRAFFADRLAFDLDTQDGAGALTLRGAVEGSGPFLGMRVEALQAPLDLEVRWSAEGLAVTPRADACPPVAFAALQAPGMRFEKGRIRLCAAQGAFYRADAQGRLSGGVFARDVRLAGAMEGGAPARLAVSDVAAQLTGRSDAPALRLAAVDAALDLDFAPDRPVRVRMGAIPGELRFAKGGWSATGALEKVRYSDPALPAELTQLDITWRAAPQAGEVAIDFSGGEGAVTASGDPALFQPLRVHALEGRLAGGAIDATGALSLAGDGASVGVFSTRHEIASGIGFAEARAENLVFSAELEAYEVSELARGVVENVRGPVNASLRAVWGGNDFALTGAVTLGGVSAATAGLGPVENVHGTVRFDDLATLSSPPGQALSIGSINPGVRLVDGEVRFQLKENGTIALEGARFPFAGGALNVAPTEIVIGAEESRYIVELSSLDLATFLAEMELKDLVVTGKLSGAIPVTITPLGGTIENARLTADPGGGIIQYQGALGEEAGGQSQLAFDALKGFRYDDLVLTLEGEIDGEIVSSIQFDGVNIAPVRPVPMLPTIGRTGLPFDFNVTVRAPFRALIEQAQGTIDPREAARRSIESRASSGAVQGVSVTVEPDD